MGAKKPRKRKKQPPQPQPSPAPSPPATRYGYTRGSTVDPTYLLDRILFAIANYPHAGV